MWQVKPKARSLDFFLVKNKLNDQAKAIIVQRHQVNCAQNTTGRIDLALTTMLSEQNEIQNNIDILLSTAESSISCNFIDFIIEEDEVDIINEDLCSDNFETRVSFNEIEKIDYIDTDKFSNWNSYIKQPKVIQTIITLNLRMTHFSI